MSTEQYSFFEEEKYPIVKEEFQYNLERFRHIILEERIEKHIREECESLQLAILLQEQEQEKVRIEKRNREERKSLKIAILLQEQEQEEARIEKRNRQERKSLQLAILLQQ